ncbi:MAG: S8 family serine peptidase [Acidobacteria bacterium]|nr:S8 family serine peptidase [Acidobacteriota bacterium]MBV9477922.1 S8 family serine peptidase [Acidobacteriota bacterium]
MRRGAVTVLALLFALPAVAQTISEPLDIAKDDAVAMRARGRVIVEFDGVPAAVRMPHAAETNRSLFSRFHEDLARINGGLAAASAGAAPRAVIRREYSVAFLGAAVEASPATASALAALPYVRRVYRDNVVRALVTGPQTPVALDGAVVNARTRVNAASLPTLGDGVRVAIIDTGIDYTHPALGGHFGPGYKVAGGHDFVNDDDDPFDDNGHGTHVAGIIAADSDTLIGVAPHATLYAFKVLNSGGGGTTDDIIAGIERAADPNGDGDPSDHVDVANMSLGGFGNADDPQSRAVDNAVAAGVVMCIAAGNAGGFAVVLSPGNAHDALTVAAIQDDGVMTTFSSRGPSPGTLAFKPDVAAPGFQIVSSFPGARTASLNGTSMASPHVAGVAALVKALHPDWDALHIKAAIISSATPLSGAARERGAGRVDADRASRATALLDTAGLSFGLDAASGGSFNAHRSFSVSNPSATPLHLSVSKGTTPSGTSISVTPTTATVAPGASQTFDAELTVQNGNVNFTEAKTVEGELSVSGDGASLKVPWLVVRSARLTITYDTFMLQPRATASDGLVMYLAPYSDTAAEFYPAPNKSWEFLFGGSNPNRDYSVTRFVHLPSRAVSGDMTVASTADDAPYAVTLGARDENGVLFGDLPHQGAPNPAAYHTLITNFDNGSPWYIIMGFASRFYLSAMPYRVTAYEYYSDVVNLRYFAVLNDTIDASALNGPVTLNKSLADYAHARLQWRNGIGAVDACTMMMMKAGGLMQPWITSCTHHAGDSAGADYYATRDSASANLSYGFTVTSDGVATPPVRAIDDEVVMSNDVNPGPLAYTFVRDHAVTLGAGPLHATGLQKALRGDAGATIGGALGETRPGFFNGMRWETYDENGALADRGIFPNATPASIGAKGRAHLFRDGFSVDGHPALFEADLVRSPSILDGVLPNVGSLRVLNAAGDPVEALANGEAAVLQFSAADGQNALGDVGPVQSDATAVAYRVHGTGEWHALANVVTSTETGNPATYGHMPPGDVNRVDLRDATAHADSLIDLRITVADRSGNTLTLTQSPAFVVGDVPVPPKRRSAR